MRSTALVVMFTVALAAGAEEALKPLPSCPVVVNGEGPKGEWMALVAVARSADEVRAIKGIEIPDLERIDFKTDMLVLIRTVEWHAGSVRGIEVLQSDREVLVRLRVHAGSGGAWPKDDFKRVRIVGLKIPASDLPVRLERVYDPVEGPRP